jgi:hypothetical protein
MSNQPGFPSGWESRSLLSTVRCGHARAFHWQQRCQVVIASAFPAWQPKTTDVTGGPPCGWHCLCAKCQNMPDDSAYALLLQAAGAGSVQATCHGTWGGARLWRAGERITHV